MRETKRTIKVHPKIWRSRYLTLRAAVGWTPATKGLIPSYCIIGKVVVRSPDLRGACTVANDAADEAWFTCLNKCKKTAMDFQYRHEPLKKPSRTVFFRRAKLVGLSVPRPPLVRVERRAWSDGGCRRHTRSGFNTNRSHKSKQLLRHFFYLFGS